MRDVDEILGTAVDMARRGQKARFLVYTETSEIYAGAKAFTKSIIDKQYKEVDEIVSILSRYNISVPLMMNLRLCRPIGKRRTHREGSKTKASKSKSNYSIRFKAIKLCRKERVDAFKLFEGRDLFFVDLQTFFRQVRQRILSLKNVLRTKYAGELAS